MGCRRRISKKNHLERWIHPKREGDTLRWKKEAVYPGDKNAIGRKLPGDKKWLKRLSALQENEPIKGERRVLG